MNTPINMLSDQIYSDGSFVKEFFKTTDNGKTTYGLMEGDQLYKKVVKQFCLPAAL